jgi:large subunit ribosomal protein L16
MLNGPKKMKYKKTKKGKLVSLEFKSNKLKFGRTGLKVLESAILNTRQIEAARRSIVRKIQRKGKVWIRVFPNVPITAKSTGTRMGKGKGSISYWGVRVRGGTVIFEICGANSILELEALKAGGNKLSVKTRIFS